MRNLRDELKRNLTSVIDVHNEFPFDLGTKPEASFGCAALPNYETEFRTNFSKTLEYAKAFNCKK